MPQLRRRRPAHPRARLGAGWSGRDRFAGIASVFGQVGLARLGPNLMARSERLLALFRAAGFPPGEADQAMSTVVGMTTGEAAYLSLLARSGQTEQEWADSVRSTAEQAVRDHLRLRDEYAARRDDAPAKLREDDFTYGLDRVLDGLAGRVSG